MRKIGTIAILASLMACSHAESLVKKEPTVKSNKEERQNSAGIRFSKFEGRPVLVIENLYKTEVVKSKLGANSGVSLFTKKRKFEVNRTFKKVQLGASSGFGNSLVSTQEEDDIALVRVSSGSGSDTFLICGQIQNPCEVTDPEIGSRQEGCGGTFDLGSGDESLEDVYSANVAEIEQTCKSEIGGSSRGGNSI